MDPMEVLLRRKKDEASMQALVGGLRRNKDIGNISMLSGDSMLGKFGAGLSNQVDSDVKMKVAQGDKEDQRAMTQGYYDQMGAQSALANTMKGRQMTETERHNKAMEEAALLKAQASGLKQPSVSAQKRTTEAIESYEGISRVLGGYKKEYANTSMNPWEGKASNLLGKTIVSSEAMKDQSRWWADYDLLYTLGRRNKLFGSALTDSEIKAWEGANISPNSPPDVIERGLRTLSEIAMRKLQQQRASDQTLFSPLWVDSQYGSIGSMPQVGVAPSGGASDLSPPPANTGEMSHATVPWGELK